MSSDSKILKGSMLDGWRKCSAMDFSYHKPGHQHDDSGVCAGSRVGGLIILPQAKQQGIAWLGDE